MSKVEFIRGCSGLKNVFWQISIFDNIKMPCKRIFTQYKYNLNDSLPLYHPLHISIFLPKIFNFHFVVLTTIISYDPLYGIEMPK